MLDHRRIAAGRLYRIVCTGLLDRRRIAAGLIGSHDNGLFCHGVYTGRCSPGRIPGEGIFRIQLQRDLSSIAIGLIQHDILADNFRLISQCFGNGEGHEEITLLGQGVCLIGVGHSNGMGAGLQLAAVFNIGTIHLQHYLWCSDLDHIAFVDDTVRKPCPGGAHQAGHTQKEAADRGKQHPIQVFFRYFFTGGNCKQIL